MPAKPGHHPLIETDQSGDTPEERQLGLLQAALHGGSARHATPQPSTRGLAAGLPKSSHTPDGVFPPAYGSSRGSFDALCGPQLGQYGARSRAVNQPPPHRVRLVAGPPNTEGVAEFMSRALLAAACAVATGAGLQLGWRGVNLTRVLTPTLIDWAGGGEATARACRASTSCQVVEQSAEAEGECEAPASARFLVALPLRSAYHTGHSAVGTTVSGGQPALPRPMAPDVAAACVVSALFAPGPAISHRLPRFEKVRRALRDPRTLSIGIYARSFDSEAANQRASDASLDATAVPSREQWSAAARQGYARTAACALALERRWAPGFDRIVWYVSTDSIALRSRFISDFDDSRSMQSGRGGPGGETGDGRGGVGGETREGGRAVLSSGSHGRHSRPSSLAEQGEARYEASVVEAIADWWLLGEVDVGVLGSWAIGGDYGVGSFGSTAFARGARSRSVFGNLFGKRCDAAEQDSLPMWPSGFRNETQRSVQPARRPMHISAGLGARTGQAKGG